MQRTIKQTVQELLQKNGESDIFCKAFLKPIEIALKTWQTDKKPEKQGSLPYGLHQVIKKEINENKYVLTDFNRVDEHQTDFKKLVEKSQDNLISVLKPIDGRRGIKLAICICMYSEDKALLKKTLKGVSDNVALFNTHGIRSHQIGVFLIMDGIEVIDDSVLDYVEILEKQNNIYLADDSQPLNPHDLISQSQMDDDDEEYRNVNLNNFVYLPDEQRDRRSRRLSSRKTEYKRVKNMIKKIQELEKSRNLTFEGLDQYVKVQFIKRAKNKHRSQYAEDDDEINKRKDDFYIEHYANNVKVASPLIQQALSETKRYCVEYIETRDNLALLSSFRVNIEALGRQSKDVSDKKEKNKYEDLQREEELEQVLPKMNLFLITKYKNRGKLSSHNWFFNGICQELNPEFSVLLDVGLAPERDALFKMIKQMEYKKTIGGVCGYMGLKIERVESSEEVDEETIDAVTSFCKKLFDIQRAQQLEYHFAHLIDKPFESMYNFIHVLPGAFSAYRMQALRPHGNAKDSALLKKYFASIEGANSVYTTSNFSAFKSVMYVLLPETLFYCFFNKPEQNSDEQMLYNQNVYLAEDRTLCMGIHENGFDLTYLPDAYAWVDPIKTLWGLLGQRKRWINGSYFAFNSVKETMSTNKNKEGECCLSLQIAYLTFMNLLAFVAPALFMFTIHIAFQAFQQDVVITALFDLGLVSSKQITETTMLITYLIDFIYTLNFLGFIFYSMHLTNRHPKFKTFIYGSSTFLGVMAYVVIIVLVQDIVSGFLGDKSYLTNNQEFISQLPLGTTLIDVLRYMILAIMGLYIIPILISIFAFCRFDFLVDILFSTPAFIFYSPTYLNILNTYAICRIDDISWGTKGLDSDSGGRTKDLQNNWKKIKIIHVSKYVFWNLIVGFLLLIFADSYTIRFFMTFSVMIILLVTLFFKIFIGFLYIVCYKCCFGSKEEKGVVEELDQVEITFKQIKKSIYNSINQEIDEMTNECRNKNQSAQKALLGPVSQIHKLDCRKGQNKDWKKKISDRSNILKGSSFKKNKELKPRNFMNEQKKQNNNQKVSFENNNISENSSTDGKLLNEMNSKEKGSKKDFKKRNVLGL